MSTVAASSEAPQASPPPPSPRAASAGGGSDGTNEEPLPNMVIKTLKEQGPFLPVGYPGSGTRIRPFHLRPFRLKEERELASYRDKGKGMSIGKFVAGVMTRMVATVGPHSFDSMKEPERLLAISDLSMADVLYMYMWLRYEALGEESPIVMKLGCPKCKADIDFNADLGTLEVRVVPDHVTTLRRELKLRDGFKIKGHHVDVVELEPIKWGTFLKPEFNTANSGDREMETIRSSIVGAKGVKMSPLVIHDYEMDELTKYDVNLLTNDIEEHTPGPQMVVEPECSACGGESRQMINWQDFSGFFSMSSRPAKRKR